LINILVISISSPILIGVYENDILIKSISQNGKTSDILPLIFNQLLLDYKIDCITYVNGPGSYMAIKISYIFLKTLAIINNIELLASSGFYYNNNSPIKALGKKYFFNIQNDKITLDYLNDTTMMSAFELPKLLDKTKLTSKNEPNYILPVVN
jgi:hypothetical protein